MRYIGSHGVAELHRYKYSGVDHSLVAKYVLQPFWRRFVNFFPLWMPKKKKGEEEMVVAVAVAMGGCEQWAGARKGWLEGHRSWEESPELGLEFDHFGNLIKTEIVQFYTIDRNVLSILEVCEKLFPSPYIGMVIGKLTKFQGNFTRHQKFDLDFSHRTNLDMVNGFSLGIEFSFCNMTFDAVDGKQARRTSSSSPLGELFDHGCDALACAFASLAFGSTIMSGGTTFWFWVITAVPFYLATWEHYFTNTLILPVINGPTEGLMLIYLCHFFTAIVGADWWAQPFGKSLPFLSWVPLINEIPTNKVTLFAIIVFAIIPTSLFKLRLILGALRFLGRLNGGSRSVAVWGRGEEEVGSSIQIVVTEGKRRSQLFFPMSAFGGSGRSFELEEAVVDAIGHRSLSIVERGQGLRRAVLLVGFEPCPTRVNPALSRVCASLRDGLELRRTHIAMEASPESGRSRARVAVADVKGSSHSPGSPVELSPKHPDLSRFCASLRDGLELRRTHTVIAASPKSGQPQAKATVEDFGGSSHSPGSTVELYPFVVLVGGVLIWDYLSPYDLIGNYPHLVIVGTGFAFGFLVSLFYLPFAIANALTARLNDGVPLVDDRWVLLLYCVYTGSLYLHFAVSVIHEITTALGIYCFRFISDALILVICQGYKERSLRCANVVFWVALPVFKILKVGVNFFFTRSVSLSQSNFRRSGGYCVCRLETSVGCGSDPRSANTSNEKKQGTVSLPDELIFFDILTRLLVRSLLLFRSVSKLWCSLISSPALVNLNLIQSWADHPDGFALLISVRDRCSSELVLLPASHGGDLAAHFLTLPDSTKHHSMSKNLNGLLCLHHRNRITSQLQNTFHSDNSMHICNPSTREIVKLPVNLQIPKFSAHGIIVAFDLRDENFRVIPLPRADIASANLKTNLVHGIALSARPYLIQVNGLLAVICSEHVEQNMIEIPSVPFLPYGTINTGGVLLVPQIALHEQDRNGNGELWGGFIVLVPVPIS
ncbi:hypothetical protein TEA_029756 [Camellia sinensis var. sinensis]|uniref:F-box domain-containing protein n=1 Tax=Camellia sinensis var. sinensis TaxID=542762 RepID=A0A4S4EXQ6_CAMSN|nr:hypothetical protein TEA_029756 [Camellia sinensis var. sinensis]